MKFKSIAAAAALAAALTPVHATIAYGSGSVSLGTIALGGELFLVAHDQEAKVSYTKDLGLRQYSSGAITGFLTTGQSELGANVSFSLAGDTAFADFLNNSTAANRTWAVIAQETFGVPSLFTTVKRGEEALVPTQLNGTFGIGTSNVQLGAFIVAVNGTGTHPLPGGTSLQQVNKNGSSFNRESDSGRAYWSEMGGGGPNMNNTLEFSNANAFGTSSLFYAVTRGPSDGISLDLSPIAFDVFDNAAAQGTWTFGNAGGEYALTYALAPVPEPGTYALMLAGLAAVGGLTRRRLRG